MDLQDLQSLLQAISVDMDTARDTLRARLHGPSGHGPRNQPY